MKTFPLIMVSLSLLGCSASKPEPAPDSEQLQDVSLIRLIAQPDKYEGKLVRIHGFIHRQFESSTVYLHREDHEHGIVSNGLWLADGKCIARGGTPFNTGYAVVEGRFTGLSHGHLGGWPGEMRDIQRCQEMP